MQLAGVKYRFHYFLPLNEHFPTEMHQTENRIIQTIQMIFPPEVLGQLVN